MCVRTVLRRVAQVCLLVLVCSCESARAQLLASETWSSVDIGNPALAGQVSTTQNGFTIAAGGADVWGTSDQFTFVWQPVTGDVDVRLRVDAVAMASAWSKAGVMIRGSLDANAAHGFALVSAGKGVAFQRRTVPGGDSTHTPGPASAPPYWVRLARSGQQLTAYSSADGVAWTIIATDTVQLGATAYVGVAVTSHNTAAVTTASVSQVSISQQGLPSGQGSADVGSPGLAGTESFSAGRYTISGSGKDIWGAADQFHYVYQQAAGDVDVSVRVESIGYADAWSKAGVMIRQSLAAGAPHAFALASAGKGYAFQRRANADDLSVHTAGPSGTSPGWLRLKRSGSLVTAYHSTDGVAWTAIGSDSIVLTDPYYVGIAVTSHNAAASTVAVADSFAVIQTPGQPLPPSPPPVNRPVSLLYNPSPDDAMVTGYVLEIFPAGVVTAAGTPGYQLTLGKPAADASGVVTVDITSFFNALPQGSYQATVSALSDAGSARSDPFSVSR